jgi:hypothetical protein
LKYSILFHIAIITLKALSEWVTDIRDQYLRAKVPFFFKQWGGVQKKKAGRILEGRTWDEMPVMARAYNEKPVCCELAFLNSIDRLTSTPR